MITAQLPDKANILLVDDQPSRLLSYQVILDDPRQNLVCANSGEEALRCVLDHEFAVIILDVSMPGMDGFETAAMIHEHPRFERTPIIFVTGVHDSELDRLKGYKLGAVDYVAIPIVPEILRSKVSVLVELYGQRLALQQLNHRLEESNGRLEIAHQSLLLEKNRALEAVNADLLRSNAGLESLNQTLKLEVSERLRAEAALKQTDRQKDEFLAVLAHELRNPLAPIRNAVEILRHSQSLDPRFTYARDVIDRQLVHISRLMDDLLDIARVTRGTIRLEKVPVPVSVLVRRSLETAQPVLMQHRHRISVKCEDETLRVEGDLTRLVQVIANLIMNAGKYTPDGGNVQLAVTRKGQSVEIAVRDDGIGIAADDIPKLFSLFSRIRGEGAETHEGLGVGLALVRRLVELHGGNVWVSSAGLGKGSEFFVRLPLLREDAKVQRPHGPNEAGPEPRGSAAPARMTEVRDRVVMIADDNRDALESLALLLDQVGYSVLKATDGLEAIQIAQQNRPDLLLVDIGMPGADGYEVARRLRMQDWSASATLVAVSGWGQPQDVERAIDAGFDFHMIKPIDFAALDALLQGQHPPRAAYGPPSSRALQSTAPKRVWPSKA